MFSIFLVMHKYCVSIPSKNVCIHLAFTNAVLDRIRVQDVPGNFKHFQVFFLISFQNFQATKYSHHFCSPVPLTFKNFLPNAFILCPNLHSTHVNQIIYVKPFLSRPTNYKSEVIPNSCVLLCPSLLCVRSTFQRFALHRVYHEWVSYTVLFM